MLAECPTCKKNDLFHWDIIALTYCQYCGTISRCSEIHIPKERSSLEIAANLYRRLEYHRNWAPSIYGTTEELYRETDEAKLADKALMDFEKETGIIPTPKPTH